MYVSLATAVALLAPLSLLLVLARWLGAWPLPRCRDASARAFTCDAMRPAYRVLAALYSGLPPPLHERRTKSGRVSSAHVFVAGLNRSSPPCLSAP
jgi:hypothetical protein